MKNRHGDPIASLLADGEAPVELEARRAEPEVRDELAAIERLSRALQVPEDVAQPDPFFVTRFRARRDAVRSGVGGRGDASTWRGMALRLLPLAVSALLAATVAIWISGERTSALGQLEMTELGDGVADVTVETAEVEPVLRIALGEL